jgi:hypothetical protein
MATIGLITDYSSLQAAVAEYLKRTDLTDKIKVFIQLAEARMFTEPELNTRNKEARITAPTVANQAYYGFPTDAKALRYIKLQVTATRTKILDYMPPQRFDDEFPDELDIERLKEPIAWTIKGDEIVLGPPPNVVYTMEIFYHKKYVNLSDAAPTNTLLTASPDLYLYGSLLESAPYLIGDERLGVWAELYKGARERIVEQDRRDRIPDGGGELYTQISEVMLDYSRRGYLY